MPFKNPTWNFFHQREATTTFLFKSLLLVSKKTNQTVNVTRCFMAVFERFSLVLKNPHYWRTTNLTYWLRFSPRRRWTVSRFKSTFSVVGQQSVILKLEVHQARMAKCQRCWAFQKFQGLLGGVPLSRWPVFSTVKWGYIYIYILTPPGSGVIRTTYIITPLIRGEITSLTHWDRPFFRGYNLKPSFCNL